MIPSKGQRKFALERMIANHFCHCLADSRHESGPFEDANWGIVLSIDILELMVPIKLDIPPETG